MSAEYNTEWESSTEPGKSRFLTRVTTRRDEASGRFEVLSADWRGATAAPEESIPTSRNHRLWTGEKAFDLGISDKTVMFVSKEAQGFVTDNAAYSGGEMLKGTVGSFRPAWDVMAKQADTRVLDSPEVVGGVPCLVLKGSGPYGEMTLWVDDATKAHGSQLKKSGSPPSISILISRLKARSNWMCRMAPKFGMRMCPG